MMTAKSATTFHSDVNGKVPRIPIVARTPVAATATTPRAPGLRSSVSKVTSTAVLRQRIPVPIATTSEQTKLAAVSSIPQSNSGRKQQALLTNPDGARRPRPKRESAYQASADAAERNFRRRESPSSADDNSDGSDGSDDYHNRDSSGEESDSGSGRDDDDADHSSDDTDNDDSDNSEPVSMRPLSPSLEREMDEYAALYMAPPTPMISAQGRQTQVASRQEQAEADADTAPPPPLYERNNIAPLPVDWTRVPLSYYDKRHDVALIASTALPVLLSRGKLQNVVAGIATLCKALEERRFSVRCGPGIAYVDATIPQGGWCFHSGRRHTTAAIASLGITRTVETVLSIASCCDAPSCADLPGLVLTYTLPFRSVVAARIRVDMQYGHDRREQMLATDGETLDAVQTLSENFTHDAAAVLDHTVTGDSFSDAYIETENVSYSSYNARWCRRIRFLSNDADVRQNVIGKSGTGTGKTKQIVAHIKAEKGLKPKVRIVSLVSRRTMASTHRNAFKECKVEFESYLSRKIPKGSSLAERLCVIVSVDSSHRLRDGRGALPQPDLLLLDEASAIFKYIATCSNLREKRGTVWATVCELVHKAVRVLILDADFSSFDSALFARIRDPTGTPSRTLIHHNLRRTNTKRYHVHHTHGAGVALIIAALRVHKRVCIAFDSKKRARAVMAALEAAVPQLQRHGTESKVKDPKWFALYDGEATPSDHRDIRRCVKVWVTLDVAAYTSVILYGVNFNHKGHFHFAVGFFTGHSVDANDAFQMLERSRTLLDNTVHLCFEGHPTGETVSYC